MEPRIEILGPKNLAGICMEMSYADIKTKELWQKFMPRRDEVKGRISTDYISMQVYRDHRVFSPDATFIKWAAVEVSARSKIPAGMKRYMLTGGKYAVFTHKGPASSAAKTIQYIFSEWLPGSEYSLDNREHFELLPKGYDPMDPGSTEEIWVPIRDNL